MTIFRINEMMFSIFYAFLSGYKKETDKYTCKIAYNTSFARVQISMQSLTRKNIKKYFKSTNINSL